MIAYGIVENSRTYSIDELLSVSDTSTMRAIVPTLDALTGTLARASMMPALQAAIDAAHAATTPLALLVIDIDYFKTVNDAFGHLRGDEILVEVAGRLRTLAPAHEMFRYGGDEFVIILRHTTPDAAHAFAITACQHIHTQPFGSDLPLTLSLTIGCANLDRNTTTAHALFERADQRLLAAKRAGRNRVFSDDGWEASEAPASRRLIEREAAYSTLQAFSAELLVQRRGQLTVAGVAGSGRTAFLNEARRRLEVQGFMVVELRCNPGLRMRDYGALYESTAGALPDPAASTEAWIAAVETLLQAEQRQGLIFAIDGVHDLDQATSSLIRAMLRKSKRSAVGIITTTTQTGQRRSRVLTTRYAIDLELAPLTIGGVGIWLRSALQWETPPEFHTWLHQQTLGLPARLDRSIPELIAQKILTSDASGWNIHPGFASRSLADRLAALVRPRPHNVPFPASNLIGREREIEQIKRALDLMSGPVTVVGPGGIGKTRLAQQVTLEIVEHYADGAWFIPLADISTAEQMVYTIMNVLHVTLVAQQPALQQLINALHDRELLLVVDNLEHIQDSYAILYAIVAHAPTVSLLLTSREAIALPQETVVELAGLHVWPAVDSQQQSSAVRLFRQIATTRGYALKAADMAAVSTICRLVEGVPLGIELAVAWIELFSCEEIAEQLASNHQLLHELNGSAQGDLGAIFDYFWRQLSPDEQRVVRGLGVYRGGFEREAAHTITGASPFLLGALVNKAFLTRTHDGRYTLHKLLQQYAERHLTAWPDQHRRIRHEHAMYYLALAQRAEREILGMEQTAWLDRMDAEHDNLRIALEWAHETDNSTYGCQLIGHIGHFWRVRGHCTEGRAWIQRS